MIASTASFKFKSKLNLEVPPLTTTTLYNEKIRKSAANIYLENRFEIPIKKDRTLYRRVITETNEP
jgi:hypothetical protein